MSGDDSIYIAKMVSIPVLFVVLGVSTLLPWILKRLGRLKGLLSILVCISAGAMMGIAFLHMLPETREIWEHYFEAGEHHVEHAEASHYVSPTGYSRLGRVVRYHHPDHPHPHGPTAEEDHVHEGHAHPYPYTEMIACLVVLALVSLEATLIQYMQKSGSNESHGHSHCDLDVEAHDHSIELETIASSNKDSTDQSVAATNIVEVCTSPKDHCTTSDAVCPKDDGLALETFHAHKDAHAHDVKIHLDQELTQKDVSVSTSKITVGAVCTTTSQDTAPSSAVLTKEETDDEDESCEKDEWAKRRIEAYATAVAIIIHSLFNGLALGADSSAPAQFWAFFGASIGHKLMDGLAVGIPIYRAKLPFLWNAMFVLAVAASTPIGVVIGYTVSEANESSLARAILMSISAGSFIFVALFEMFPAALRAKSWLWVKLLAIGVGFAGMAIVAKWT